MWYPQSHEVCENHDRRSDFTASIGTTSVADADGGSGGPRRIPDRQASSRRSHRSRPRRAPRPGIDVKAPSRSAEEQHRRRSSALTLLDSYTLVALLADEPTADEVKDLLRDNNCRVIVVNLAEAVDISQRI